METVTVDGNPAHFVAVISHEARGSVAARTGRPDTNMATWDTFATAPDQLTAEMWSDLVRQAGVECAIRAGDTTGFLGLSPYPVRLVTRKSDLESARAALDAVLGRGADPGAPNEGQA